MDVVVLGATEVDVNFNANVVTHSDGRLLHGIGGWQNCLFAGCTILAVPSFRLFLRYTSRTRRLPRSKKRCATICCQSC